MAVIKEDIYGLYAYVGGYVARPSAPSKYKVGDKPEGKHFGGSSRIGMGKEEGRGKYTEHWRTAGVASEHRKGKVQTIAEFMGY